MVYCEKNPYYINSNEYFRKKYGGNYEITYWQWMMQEYKTVLLDKMGSYSDVRDQHWAFNTEKDRTFFILRWSS